MKINKDGINVNDYDLYITRFCSSCNNPYKIIDTDINSSHFYPPYDYIKGCSEYCLHCWLLPDDEPSKIAVENEQDIELIFPENHQYWYDTNDYEKIDLGDLQTAYKKYIEDGFQIAILPISRLATNRSIFLPEGIMIYPEGRLDLSKYKLINTEISKLREKHPSELSISELSSLQSQLTGISIETLNQYALIVIPIKLSLDTIFNYSHEKHLELISNLSETITQKYLNFFIYKYCKISHISNDKLPSSPSQTLVNNMSAVLFVNLNSNESKLISGAVFNAQATKGLGLALSQPEWDIFPKNGEVGKLVNHAMILYSQIIKTESSTSKFVQILSLLEFLAYPTEYKKFQDVKKVISRYIIQDTNSSEYQDLLKRFEELTGKIDSLTGEQVGLRTRIVHIGDRLENLLPTTNVRKQLFEELNGYVRCIIDHMIHYSDLSFEDYLDKRKELINT
ncbi:hypothetical protein [Halarcobacter ebronensis]|uniref:Apea-like HEPN domain-containing protein n=1 Tax=Halarcobacter ebronensis TaxID=1462615 RepID=A0A4Q1AQL2_9BACT|nr:hypothetical protein [Halarcobacter ebronensis]QKF81673.1 hypothetical protein AEBR_1179 [Halarcobacter ebronensis]RXK05598.1 hypothetical protein CRV07_08810 [Halarcobacter ebronensis]